MAHRPKSTPPIVPTSNDGILPFDLIHHILLRLPVDHIFRCRTVCRSWRSILCHPDFIAAVPNASPLLAAAVSESFDSSSSTWSYKSRILDVEYGNEVKRYVRFKDCPLDSMSHERVVWVKSTDQRIGLLDPATGAKSILPDHEPPPDTFTWCTIGQAASGELKVLAVITAPMMSNQVSKILTLTTGDTSWRETGSPPLTSSFAVVAVNGVAYLSEYLEESACPAHQMIMEFDLDCEAWRPASLRGPKNLLDLSLADLHNQLVAGYNDANTTIDLWFMVDSERSIWSKRYTIHMPQQQSPSPYLDREYFEKPLAVLDDGRIVMWMRVDNSMTHIEDDTFLRLYDPRTKTFSDGTIVHNCNEVSVFTWSLLNPIKCRLDRAARLAFIRRRHH